MRKKLRTKGVLVRRLPRWFGLLEPAWRDQIALQLGGPGGEKRREEKNQLVCPEPVLAKQHCFSDEPHSTMQTNSLNANVFVAVLALWRDDMRAGEKNVLFEQFMYKNDLLPRQARDKHRKSLKRVRFSQSSAAGIAAVIQLTIR